MCYSKKYKFKNFNFTAFVYDDMPLYPRSVLPLFPLGSVQYTSDLKYGLPLGNTLLILNSHYPDYIEFCAIHS